MPTEYLHRYIYIWKEGRKESTCSIRLRPPTLFPHHISGGLRKRHRPPPRRVPEGVFTRLLGSAEPEGHKVRQRRLWDRFWGKGAEKAQNGVLSPRSGVWARRGLPPPNNRVPNKAGTGHLAGGHEKNNQKLQLRKHIILFSHRQRV